MPRSTNPFNPSWQPLPDLEESRYINPFHNHQTSTYLGQSKVKYESNYSPNYDLKYDRSHMPIDPFSAGDSVIPYVSANRTRGALESQIPYRTSNYLSQQMLDQRSRFDQHRLSYQERYEPHKYDSTSRYEPSSKYDHGKYQTELYDNREKYDMDKYDSLKPQEPLGSAYSLYDPAVDHSDPRRRRDNINGIYDPHIRDLARLNHINHNLDQRSSPIHSPSTTVNNQRLYHTIPGRGLRNFSTPTSAYLDYEAKQLREQQLHHREQQLQQQQKELQQKQIQQKQQVKQEKQQQDKIDRAIEYERRLRDATHEPPPPPAPLAPAQVGLSDNLGIEKYIHCYIAV